MRTLHSVLKHGGLYWDRSVASPGDCEARFRRVQKAVAASGDDAWLIFGDVERSGNIVYVSHFLPRVRSALVFVPRDGAPVLLANIGLRDVPAAKTITWIEEVRVFGRLPKEVIDKVRNSVPMGYVAEPEDVAGVVAFLASDDARYITGQSILIDGGRWMI